MARSSSSATPMKKTIDAEVVPSSIARSPAPTASVDDADDTDKDDALDRAIGGSSSGENKAGLP
jgi:hypothetical protein